MDVTALARPLPSGPWDKQINEYVRFKKIAILIHNLSDDSIAHEFIIDYGNAEHRKWLGKLTWYATNNNMSIETMSFEEWERMK